MADAGQLIHEPAVDEEGDDGEKEHLAEACHPSRRSDRRDDRESDSSESDERCDHCDADATVGKEKLSTEFQRSVTHETSQVSPLIERIRLVRVRRRTDKPEAPAMSAHASPAVLSTARRRICIRRATAPCSRSSSNDSGPKDFSGCAPAR